MPRPDIQDFAIPGVVSLEAAEGGLIRVAVRNAFADADIYLLGGHVARFQPKGQSPVLWMSPKSPFAPGKALRGGVPVCWPWFGPSAVNKDWPSHGFARSREWFPVSVAQLSDGRTRVELGLDSDASTKAFWPHDFSLRLVATVGASLDLELVTANTGADPLRYEEALHTYFAVSNAEAVRVEGFDGAPYADRAAGDVRRVQSGPIAFSGLTTKILFARDAACAIVDPGLKRRIVVRQSNAGAAVAWNPGAATAATMPEIAEHWSGFVCLETANCLESPVILLPGSSHATRTSYSVEAL